MTQLHIKSLNHTIEIPLFGINLADWVHTIHINLSSKYEMKAIEIENGDFGFESYACVLLSILSNVDSGHVFKSIQGDLDIVPFIELAHSAWTANYIFWKNLEFGPVSKQGINTKERNDRSTTSVKNLSDEDKSLYEDIILEVFKVLAQQILNAGFQKLTI